MERKMPPLSKYFQGLDEIVNSVSVSLGPGLSQLDTSKQTHSSLHT